MQQAQLQVLRAEVVPPLADAVRLVDGEQAEQAARVQELDNFQINGRLDYVIADSLALEDFLAGKPSKGQTKGSKDAWTTRAAILKNPTMKKPGKAPGSATRRMNSARPRPTVRASST